MQVRQRKERAKAEAVAAAPISLSCLSLSAGMAIVDTGAAQDLIGMRAFRLLSKAWRAKGMLPLKLPKVPRAAMGIGGQARPVFVALCPLSFQGKTGVLELTVLAEDIPQLLRASFLAALGAVINLPQNKMRLQNLQVEVPLQEGPGGHRLVSVIDDCAPIMLPEKVQTKYSISADALILKSRRRHLIKNYPESPSEGLPSEQNASSCLHLAMEESDAASAFATSSQSTSRSMASCVQADTSGEHAGRGVMSSQASEEGWQSACKVDYLPGLPGQDFLHDHQEGQQESGGGQGEGGDKEAPSQFGDREGGLCGSGCRPIRTRHGECIIGSAESQRRVERGDVRRACPSEGRRCRNFFA